MIHTLTSPHIDECPQCQAEWDKRNRGISRRRFSITAIGGLFAAVVKIETPAFRFPSGAEIATGDSFRHAVYYGNDGAAGIITLHPRQWAAYERLSEELSSRHTSRRLKETP